ncbi:MAG: M20/M25/M40 family metallo-hydrolase [Candidatus Promineifilaceae bacterium]
MSDHTIYQRPAELLQALIRFDTTNPPGNEAAIVAYIAGLLADAGIESVQYAKDPNRPNLVARLKGNGRAAPLLLQGHVDVVTTANQQWQHDPFGGELIDGYVWGRGALDMKGGVAMMVAAFLRAKAEGANLPGDVILTILADEEDGGRFGAKFLVDQHPELFTGVKYAIGEFGGFTLDMFGQRFYPIMVAEKQICWLELVVRGPGGHGSRPLRGGAMAKLGTLLTRLDQNRLPVHVTPAAEAMYGAMAAALPEQFRPLFMGLLNPETTDQILDNLGEQARLFDPMFHNTVSPTIVRGGHKVNVIPSEIRLEADGRLLPGFTPDDLVRELRELIGDDVEIHVKAHDPGPAAPNMGLFAMLGKIVEELDGAGTAVPLMLTGVTDARFFSQLGIQTYGFLPMNLPPDFRFTDLIHAADERVPAEAISFGANAVYQALLRFHD